MAPHAVEIPFGSLVGLLCFRSRESTKGFAAVEVLSRDGDLREAAINLFAALHRLDAMGLNLIVADTVPETGLGVAVMDRLRRASREPSALFEHETSGV